VGSNKSLVGRQTYMKQIEASKLQKGGLVIPAMNNGGIVPDTGVLSGMGFGEDTTLAALKPKEVVLPAPDDVLSRFNSANELSRGQQVGTMVMQPIIVNSSGGGGGGGGGSSPTPTAASVPNLPNNPSGDFAANLIMTQQLLSSRIGG